MDEVFAALMKKVYVGEEFLLALSPVLKSPHKGADIIFNTLPFPGHVSKDSEVRQQSPSTKRRMTSKIPQINHDSKHDALPVQTLHTRTLLSLSGVN